jgi:hypothetical protein
MIFMPGESKDMLVLLLRCILFTTQSAQMYHFNTSRVMLFNATFNNISVISWRSALNTNILYKSLLKNRSHLYDKGNNKITELRTI